jgi:tetratricopeptide (TPR) repeat protein
MREAEGLATRLGDPARLGRVLADICARLRNVAGQHLQAIEVGQRALAIAAETGDRELEREAQYRTGQAYFAIGDFRQALDFFSRCAEGAGEGHDQRSPLFASWSHSWLALTLSSGGRFVDARAHAQEALRIAEGADHPFTLAEALTGVGSVSLAQGDFERAIDALERARVLIRTWNLQPWAVLARLGYAYALSARPDEGRDLLEEVIQNATTMSSMGVGRAMQLTWLGETYLLEGRVDDALERSQEAVSLARRHQERGHEAWSLRLLGEIASRRDPPVLETAEGYYREALALAAQLGMRPLAAHCHFDLGRLFRKIDQHEQARQHLTTATTMFREMDMRFWLDQAEAEMRELA